MIRLFAALVFLLFTSTTATSQEIAWIQVEAQPTLTQAQARVRAYAGQFDDVAGFRLRSGWYGVALGPYGRADAESLLADLRRSGQIPRDSFIADGGRFAQQFWPVGAAVQTAQPLPGSGTTPVVISTDPNTAEPTAELVIDEPEPIEVADETPREARASESLLNRDERKELQFMLQWAGFYNSAIDGAFGRGTRGSMAAWQEANNHEPTGVMTTLQRAQILQQYNAVLEGIDLTLTRDDTTGIQILIPLGVVGFDRYEPPFAKYSAKGDLDAQVFLISQPGNQDRLFGMYEILQTLEIMPAEGPRNRRNASFEITGEDASIHSYSFVQLKAGEIKGFVLVWPAGDEERRTRVLNEMKDSFSTIDGVLDPGAYAPDEAQAIDLVSGLAVRKPQMSRSGFYIDGSGTVLTTSEVVQSCDRLTVADDKLAELTMVDEALGIAVLRPSERLSPLGSVAFQLSVPRIRADVAVGGFPYGGILGVPTLTFGTLADIRGLNGEEQLKRLDLVAQPGDAGGPVFDGGGAVLGMLLPRANQGGQMLPAEVSFTLETDAILGRLDEAGIATTTTDVLAFMEPATMTLQAADVTVLVSCW